MMAYVVCQSPSPSAARRIADLEKLEGGVRPLVCGVDGCDNAAVTFPPPRCTEHGGLA